MWHISNPIHCLHAVIWMEQSLQLKLRSLFCLVSLLCYNILVASMQEKVAGEDRGMLGWVAQCGLEEQISAFV